MANTQKTRKELEEDNAMLRAALAAARQQAARATDKAAQLEAAQASKPLTPQTPTFEGVLTTAREYALQTARSILDRCGGKLPEWDTCPKRRPVSLGSHAAKAWWRERTSASGAITDRLLHNLQHPTARKGLKEYLAEQPFVPVIVYGTTGAGKTRLLLEHLFRDWGYYMPAVANPVSGAGGDKLLSQSLSSTRHDMLVDDAQIHAMVPIACRALVLEQLRALDNDCQPKHWLLIQLQGCHSEAFVSLRKKLMHLCRHYAMWKEVVEHLHARSYACVCVDEAQALLSIPLLPSQALNPDDPGRRTAYGVVVRAAYDAHLGVVMAGTGMAVKEACLESAGTGAGDDRDRAVVQSWHSAVPRECGQGGPGDSSSSNTGYGPNVLQVSSVLYEEHALAYLRTTLQAFKETLAREDVQTELRAHLSAWFHGARPRFVVRLADELELLFGHPQFPDCGANEQLEALRTAVAVVVGYLATDLSSYFVKRHRLAIPMQPCVGGLLAQRLAYAQFGATTNFLDRVDEVELHQMVESGFLSVQRDGCLQEPIAEAALSHWLGAHNPVAHLWSLLHRTKNASSQGFVFKSLVCASVHAQFRKAAARVPGLVWNVDPCPFVEIRSVLWVVHLFPTSFLDKYTHVQLAGVGNASKPVVREGHDGVSSVGAFLRRPPAPFLLPSTLAGPGIVFQLVFRNSSTSVVVDVLLQCKLTHGSPVEESAWDTVLPAKLYLNATGCVSSAAAHRESTWVSSSLCLGAIVSYPKSVPPCPEPSTDASTLLLSAVDGPNVCVAMATELKVHRGCVRGCNGRCSCKRRSQVCGVKCKRQTRGGNTKCQTTSRASKRPRSGMGVIA